MLLHDFLRDAAGKAGDNPSIIFAKRSYSFREIDALSDRLACRFQEIGIVRGDRIAAMLDNGIELVLVLWAALKAGAVFIPIGPGTKPDTLAFLLADSGAACLVSHTQLRAQVAQAIAKAAYAGALIWAGPKVAEGEQSLDAILAGPHEVPADPGLIDQDLSLIIYTSGSTGTPKGVMMPHVNMSNNVLAIAAYMHNTPDDVIMCLLPLSYSYGLSQILVGAHVGYSVLIERSFAFPYDVLKRVGEYKVTGIPGVPTFFATLLQCAPFKGLDLTSLRYFTNAAQALPAPHILELRRLFPTVQMFSMYGQTECTRVCYLDPARVGDKPKSVGKAMPNCELHIVNEEGQRCAPNEVGELVVRGMNVMRGYWRRPEETAAALRDWEIPGEKVLFTGDLFYKDEEGDLFFVGRRDDVFKCRGEKVSPREVEACLCEFPAVGEAAVIGVPHPTDGFAVKAYIVPRAGAELSEDELRKHCRAKLEPLLVPRFFEFCESLPKTESGKVSKTILRKQAEAS